MTDAALRPYRRVRQALWGLLWVVLLACVVGGPTAAQAQVTEVPPNEQAALRFDEGVAAFERGDYEQAYRRFQAAADYPLNTSTTAALLMAGKALYRMGRYRDAVDVLSRLVERYPTSGYVDDAQRVIGFAQTALDARGGGQALRLGILLPLSDDDVTLSQALFNGVRLAVDEANGIERQVVDTTGLRVPEGARIRTIILRADSSRRTVMERPAGPQTRPVRMFFRASGSTPDDARAAVDSLVTLDRVDVIVGPLYSRQARAAGAAAERSQAVLVAPLATDEAVSAGRSYVFQANPTIEMRGRQMARFAARGLLMDMTGLLVEDGNAISERMARGFKAEAREQGMGVLFETVIDNSREWSNLPEKVRRDTLGLVDAVYLPIAGRDAGGRIQDALTGLERLRTDVRVLGNAEWHDLAVEQQASAFNATYTNDFYLDETRPEVQDFVRRFRLLTGETPDLLDVSAQRLAYTGYDVARFLIQTLPPDLSGGLREALREARRYEGLGLRIDFAEGNVNEALFYHRYRGGAVELLR